MLASMTSAFTAHVRVPEGETVRGYGAAGSEETQQQHIESWRRQSNDVRFDGILVPADMTMRWQQYLDGTKDLVTPEEWILNREGLPL